MHKIITFLILNLISLLSYSQSFYIKENHADQGQTLTVNFTGFNTHFSQGSSTYINFDFNQGSSTVVNSINVFCDTKMQANITVPKNTPTGDYSVTIYNSIDGLLTLTEAFHVNGKPLPQLVSISPNNAKAGETLDVLFTGLNTNFSQASSTIIDFEFYQASQTIVNSVKILSDTSIKANITIPNSVPSDYYTASIYNEIDGYLYLNYEFQVIGKPKPIIVSLSPDSAKAGESLDIIFTGLNTNFTKASSTIIEFDFSQGSTTAVNSYQIISDTKIKANLTVPSNVYSGDYLINFYNNIDGYLDLPNNFHVTGKPLPTLVSISPDTAKAGETLDIIFTGINTNFNQASATSIYFDFNQASQTLVNSYQILSDTEIKANLTVPAKTSTGDYAIYFYNDLDGYLYLENALHIKGVPKPKLISINPSTAQAGENLDVIFTGLNTNFSQASNTYIYFDFNQGSQTIVNSIKKSSNTILSANISIPKNCKTGYYDVFMYNEIDGYMSLLEGFNVNGQPNPQLLNISPDNGEAGETLNVTFTGLYTNFKQASFTSVSFDFSQASSTINSVTIISDTQLTANIKIPQKTFDGDFGVSVYNEIDGFLYLPASFHVREKAPASIISVFPNNAEPGQTLNISITGLNTHFLKASETGIDFSFNEMCGKIVNSIKATSNNTLIANITVPKNTKLGNYDLFLYNTYDELLKLDKGFNIGKTGIEINHTSNSFDIYPNPSNGRFNIQNNNPQTLFNETISIYNTQGKLILNQLMQERNTEINLENFSKGVYIIKLQSDAAVKIQKVILK